MEHCFRKMEKNQNQIWVQMEYKRAAVLLPLILRKAVILAALCLAVVGMIAFCVAVLQRQGGSGAKIRVGYTAQSDQITNMAVSYVQQDRKSTRLNSSHIH